MSRPITTRLRFVKAKKPETIQAFLDRLGVRVQIYGQPVWDGKKWFLWFVPADDSPDILSRDLDI